MSGFKNDMYDATYSELDVRREEVNALVREQRALDESGGNNASLAIQSPQERVGELGTRVRHREGSASSTILCLDDLVTTKLDAVHELVVGLAGNILAKVGLGKEGDDRGSAVATNDGDNSLRRLGALDTSKETGGADNIKGGDTEETTRVENTGLLESGGDDGDGGVNRVGDDKDVGFGCDAANCGSEVADNGCVGLVILVSK